MAGCGGGDEEEPGAGSLPASGGGGALSYALADLPATLDPLAAESRAEQVVSRQVHEPLVSSQSPPYGTGEAQPGLALAVDPAGGGSVWRVTLRPGVRFQDGSPFNASAVLANARRWQRSGAAAELLPGLFAVDAPRPDEVRFLFRRPRAGVRELLASPRLGIVSPQALAAADGERSAPVTLAAGSGTGAFELGDRSRGRITLSRSEEWWGSPVGLGPSLDAIEFMRVAAPQVRLDAVVRGEVQVAEFEGEVAYAGNAGPLLRGVPIGPDMDALVEASVRGFPPGPAAPPLSGVWLTRISA